jgi:RNA 3'-terminal phosphate cyclase (ATP)
VLTVDGSFGEGGGQILRSSLALSLVTGTPFRIIDIRKRRRRPGLRQQHLTAVRAAATIAQAQLEGDEIGSQQLSFAPRRPTGGEHTFSIGTAGSTTLVLQTILPALALAQEKSTLVLEGGTHNPQSPTFDFLARAYLPLVRRMGPVVRAVLERPGFYPAGGGRFVVSIDPVASLSAFDLLERGPIREQRVTASVAHLPRHIAEREIKTLSEKLRWDRSCFCIEELTDVDGPGNVVIVELVSEHVTQVFSGFGEKGVSAETVAKRLGNEVKEYLRAGVPIGRHLADQLVLLMAIAGSGAFATLSPSSHLTTQVEVIRRFLGARVRLIPRDNGAWLVEIVSKSES